MESRHRQNKNWILTQESFDRLLARLDSDRERAGEMYENLRRVLISFFEWRGCSFPEDEADETLNRMARKIAEGEEIRDLQGYCHGIARRHLLELSAKRKAAPGKEEFTDDLEVVAPADQDPAETAGLLECFEHCLSRLPAESRTLIIQYYQNDRQARIDHRAELARQSGLSLNNLRVRAFRIRAQLDECISSCLRRRKK